jgi:hypothetical protein
MKQPGMKRPAGAGRGEHARPRYTFRAAAAGNHTSARVLLPESSVSLKLEVHPAERGLQNI